MKDSIVIGGGPAGTSCALWLKMLGFQPVIIERRETLGGRQADCPYPNPWIASSPGKTGIEVAEDIHRNILSHGIECKLGYAVTTLKPDGDLFQVETADGQQVAGHTVVLASGVSPASAGIKSALNVLVGPGKHVEATDYTGKRVAILGGGDNAFWHYLLVKQRDAAFVRIFARTIRARKEFLHKVQIEDVHFGAYVVDSSGLTVSGEKYDVIIVLYGWEAHLPYISGLGIARDHRGFVLTDGDCRTSVPGIYAIGEVTQRMHPCCVTAMADGVVTAKAIQRNLEKDVVSRFMALAKRPAPPPRTRRSEFKS